MRWHITMCAKLASQVSVQVHFMPTALTIMCLLSVKKAALVFHGFGVFLVRETPWGIFQEKVGKRISEILILRI